MVTWYLFFLLFFRHYAPEHEYIVALLQFDEFDALCSTTLYAYAVHRHADSCSALGDQHQILFIGYSVQAYQRTGLVGQCNGLDALTATVGDTVDRFAVLIVQSRTLTEALLRNNEHCLLTVTFYTNHANRVILAVFVQFYCTYTGCRTSHRTNGVLREADKFTVARGDEHLALAVGQSYTNQAVALTQTERDDTVRTRTAVVFERGLFHQTVAGSKDQVVVLDVLGIVQTFDVDEGADLLVFLQVNHVLHSTAFRLAVAFRQVIDLDPVQTAEVGKEHHSRVHRRGVNVLDEIFVTRVAGLGAYTSSTLLTEISQRRTFDVAQVRDGDNHIVVGIHIFGVELGSHLHDARAALVGVLILDLLQFGCYELVAQTLVSEQLVEVCNLLLEFSVLGFQLINTQACERSQTHLHDSLTLRIVEIEALLQVRLCISRRAAGADDLNHLVDVIHGDDQALQNMRTLLCLAQQVTRTARNNIHTVLDKVAYQVFEVEQHRTAFHQGDIVHGKRALQGSELVQFVQHHLCIGITLHVNHYTYIALRLVADVGYTFYTFLVHQGGNVRHQVGFHYAIRQFGNDDMLAAVVVGLYIGVRTDDHASATGLKGVTYTLIAIYRTARREVRSLDVLHQLVNRYLFGLGIGDARFDVAYIRQASVNHLAQVMRRHVRSHTHGYTACAVHQ